MTGLWRLVLSFSACIRAMRVRFWRCGMFSNDFSYLQGGKYSRQGQLKSACIRLLLHILLSILNSDSCSCVPLRSHCEHFYTGHMLKIHLTPLLYYTQLLMSQTCPPTPPPGAASKAYNPSVIECGHPGENNSGLGTAPSALSQHFSVTRHWSRAERGRFQLSFSSHTGDDQSFG